MAANSAIDAQRTASERTASVCPECDAPPGSPHAPDCVVRPRVRYDDHLRERYARGDGEVYRIGGQFVSISELLDVI
jgi:hypothetical protein